MTWLYSLVFAGLLFSSQNGPVKVSADSNSNTQIFSVADETERFEQTYPLTPNGRVSVSNVNGSITVNAWDRNEGKLVAVKTADSKERLADVEIKVDAKPDYLCVETNYDNWKNHGNGERWRNGKLQVDYELSVPRGAVLNEIETVNGSVTVADFSNSTKISAVNGNVKATNLRGKADLSTVNGEVFANFDQLENSSRINLETVNGRVNLSIPSDSNATLRADSVNGNISNEFGLPIRKGKYVGRDLYGRLGSGGVQVKLSSVNGPLAIGRNKDGKAASPATNLLQQKNKDDDDMDEDSDNDNDDDDDSILLVNKVKIDKHVEKAMKQASKDSTVAMKQTQKTMVKMQPEIAKIDAETLRKATEAINSADVQAGIEAGVQAATQIPADIVAGIRNIRFLGASRVEKKSSVIPVKGTPTVTIDARGCSVKVKGWDRSEVQYSVIRFTTNRNHDQGQAKVEHIDNAVNITIENDDEESFPGVEGSDLPRNRIEVFVPKKSNLKITAGGEIRLEDVSGQVDLSGNEESIDVRDVDGKMSVATKCGQVRVIGFTGQLDAKTEAGNVYLEGKFDKLSANAADGTVILTLPQDANAKIVSNTNVDAEGVGLVKEKEDLWRLGKGGPTYNFDFGDGHLIVRNTSEISTY